MVEFATSCNGPDRGAVALHKLPPAAQRHALLRRAGRRSKTPDDHAAKARNGMKSHAEVNASAPYFSRTSPHTSDSDGGISMKPGASSSYRVFRWSVFVTYLHNHAAKAPLILVTQTTSRKHWPNRNGWVIDQTNPPAPSTTAQAIATNTITKSRRCWNRNFISHADCGSIHSPSLTAFGHRIRRTLFGSHVTAAGGRLRSLL